MRLIHATDYASLYPGSFIPMMRAVLRLGIERGVRSEAVFWEGARERSWLEDFEGDGIPVRLVPNGALADLLAEDDGPVVLHVHFAGLQLEAARAARRHPRAAAYWHVHTPLLPGPVQAVRNAIRFRVLSRGVREILCVAPDLADSVRRRGAPKHRVAFVPNAIDLKRFTPAGAEERRAARDRLGLPQDAHVLTHFGHDWKRKGGDLYEEAVERLARDDVVAVTFGGKPSNGSRVRRMEPTGRVEDVYAAADVFVSPSRAEGMPFAVAEALACGTPVVASDIPGHRYICGDHTGCELVPLDAGALAAALSRASGGDMAEARGWLERNMDIQVWAERLFDRYEAAGVIQRSSAVPS